MNYETEREINLSGILLEGDMNWRGSRILTVHVDCREQNGGSFLQERLPTDGSIQKVCTYILLGKVKTRVWISGWLDRIRRPPNLIFHPLSKIKLFGHFLTWLWLFLIRTYEKRKVTETVHEDSVDSRMNLWTSMVGM